jgi:hypothetical protein
MKRLTHAIVVLLLLALGAWVARNSYWEDVTVPMPMKGAALTNPFYAAQRLTTALGGRTTWDRSWSSPPTNAIVVLSTWHWALLDERRLAIERWVEAGGRLVVDLGLAGDLTTFENWSTISREFDLERFKERTKGAKPDSEVPDDWDFGARQCEPLTEIRRGQAPSPASREMCRDDEWRFLTTTSEAEWALRGEHGVQAMRLPVGRGSVTVINATPFRGRELFEGDHAWLLVAATQFQAGDEIRFLSEDDYPSLLALLWQHGGPVVVLALAIVALLLWRGWVRFGRLAPTPPSARRSLAEQIRGSGLFALRHGSGESLHAAVVRALNEAASRRIPGYMRLAPQQQTAALARLTGVDEGSLADAIYHAAARRTERLRNALALLESARRQVLSQQVRSSDGTD